MTYEFALQRKHDYEREAKDASLALRAISGGGSMGLTPDSVRNSPEWRKAKSTYEFAAALLRDYNREFLRIFGNQYRVTKHVSQK
jgi:hypothetical protein